MPRVSVVIPAYNYARFLPQAIDSALRQSFTDCEVIVVDDGSTDETPAVAARYGGRIRYHRQQNRGLSGARNAGCRIARGDFFAFLDADDQWDPEKLAEQLAVFDGAPDTGLVSHFMRFVDRDGVPLAGRKPAQAPGETLMGIIQQGTAVPSTFMVRRSCFEAVGGFDEGLEAMEDVDFCLRVARRHRLVHVPKMLGAYRAHGSSLSGTPEKIYPSYITIFERLLDDPDAARARGLVRQRLARFRYLWGMHQLKKGATMQGVRLIRQAVATWGLVGWTLDPSRPWWVRAGHVLKPYAVLSTHATHGGPPS